MNFISQLASAKVQLAGFIAKHQLFFAVADHLGKSVKKIRQLTQSLQIPITSERRKASYTIAEGIGCEQSLNIIDILEEQPFSILVDEITNECVTQTFVCKRLCHAFICDKILGCRCYANC